MKYFKLLLLSVLLIIFAIGCFSINITKNFGLKNADYLRLHIRANSNLDCDQNIKFQVKNSLLNLISNELSYLNTKPPKFKVVLCFINNQKAYMLT